MGENGNDMALGYMMGQDSNGGGGCNNGGWGFGDGGIWGFLILALLFGGRGFGFGGGGFGSFGGGGNDCCCNGGVRSAISEGFALNNITDGIRGIQQGICDSTFTLNNAITNGFHNTTVGMMNGFNGVERGFCDLSHQLAQCCCDNRAAIADLKYTIATEDCATRNLLQNNTRDIIESQNAGTRAILDFLTKDKIDTLTAENQTLRFQASQANQNAFITANQEAQTAELIRRLRTPEAVPAYVVPNPNCCYGNPLGIGYGWNGGNGCGCGCGG